MPLLSIVLIVTLLPLCAYAGLALAVGRERVWETVFGSVGPPPSDSERSAWMRLLEQEGAHRLAETENQIDVEVRTRWLRFPDHVTIRLLALQDGFSTVVVYSRAVYGLYDFGVNRKRVRSWLQGLKAELGSLPTDSAGRS